MFEEFKKYVGRKSPPNRFWTVEEGEIAAAEERLGFAFPGELRGFYREVGWGFYAKGTDDEKWNRRLVNRVLPPDEIADLLLDRDDPMRPPEGFPRRMIPFFDLGSMAYLLLRVGKGGSRSGVYWADGKQVVARDLTEFFRRLSAEAAFYRGE